MKSKPARNVAELTRSDPAPGREAEMVRFAKQLYPNMAPSPTARGYWHIRTRQGFVLPSFLPRKSDEERPGSEKHDFCAFYFLTGGRRRESDADVPAALFSGSYDESNYAVVDRTFRVLTDQVLEPAWFRLNPARGRIWGGLTGGLTLAAGVVALGLLVFARSAEVAELTLSLLGNTAYGLPLAMAGAMLVLAGVISLGGEIGKRLGAALGKLCERLRLRALPAESRHFLYGPEAGEALRREMAACVREEEKLREYRRMVRGGVELSREDFARIFDVLPYIKQLALTEAQRREEVGSLQAKIPDDFPLSPMRLAEPYVAPP